MCDDGSDEVQVDELVREISVLWEQGDFRVAVDKLCSLREFHKGKSRRWLRILERLSDFDESQKRDRDTPSLAGAVTIVDCETQLEEAATTEERKAAKRRWFLEWSLMSPSVALDIFHEELLPKYLDGPELSPYLAKYCGIIIPRITQMNGAEAERLIGEAADLVQEQEDDEQQQAWNYGPLVEALISLRRFDLAAKLLRRNSQIPDSHLYWFGIGFHSPRLEDVEGAYGYVTNSLLKADSAAIWGVLRRVTWTSQNSGH